MVLSPLESWCCRQNWRKIRLENIKTILTVGRSGRNEFECHFVETAKNAVLFAFEPERVTEFFRAIKSYIKCFCILDEDFLLQIQKGYLAVSHKISFVSERSQFSRPNMKSAKDNRFPSHSRKLLMMSISWSNARDAISTPVLLF